MSANISVRLTDGSKYDIKVEDLDNATVLSLKSLISEAIPDKPPTTLLKLVFKGRILKDEDLLVTNGE